MLVRLDTVHSGNEVHENLTEGESTGDQLSLSTHWGERERKRVTDKMDWNRSKTLFDTVFDRVKIREAFTDDAGGQEIVERVPSLTRLLYVADLAYNSDEAPSPSPPPPQEEVARSSPLSSPSSTPSSTPTPSASPASLSRKSSPSQDKRTFNFSVTQQRDVGPSSSIVSYAHERVMDIHKSFIQQAASDAEEAETILRGLMLLQNQTILNIVEASPEIVNSLLTHLKNNAMGNESCVFRNIRIIGHVEDCQRPLFPRPLFHVVQIGGGTKLELDSAEDIAPHCYDLFSRMIKIGQNCPPEGESKASIDNFLDSLTTEFQETLPPDKMVLEFAQCKQVCLSINTV